MGAPAEHVGRTAAAAVVEVGADVRQHLRPSEAAQLARHATRYLVASEGRKLFETLPLEENHVRQVFGVVETWCGRHGLALFAADYRGGSSREVADQAATRSRDAASCAALADHYAPVPFGKSHWQVSAESHAYAAVSSDPQVLRRLLPGPAEKLASAAEGASRDVEASPQIAFGEQLTLGAVMADAKAVRAQVQAWRGEVAARVAPSSPAPDFGAALRGASGPSPAPRPSSRPRP